MRKILNSFLCVALVAAFFVAGSSAAQAVPPPATRPDKPSSQPAASWGVPRAQLACTTSQPIAKTGGWTIGVLASNTIKTPPSAGGVGGRSYPTLAGIFTLGEPCINGGGVGIPISGGYFDRSGSNFKPSLSSGAGNPSTVTSASSFVVCQSAEWSTTRTKKTVAPAGPYGATSIALPYSQTPASGGMLPSSLSSTGCDYIQQVAVLLCWFDASGSYTLAGSGSPPGDCVTATWTAEAWFRNSFHYGNGGDPSVTLCLSDPTIDPDCVYVLPPGYVDPTSAAVCNDAPAAPLWPDFDPDWLGDYISHWARCLFVPAGGWDWDHQLDDAIDVSALTQVTALAQGVVGSWNQAGTCGNLLGGADPVLPGFALDTCEWTWAGYIKTPLTVFFVIWGALGIVNFVLATTLGVPNKKSSNPLDQSVDGSAT